MPAYSLDALRKDVAAGSIDTVLVAFPDMQGRMIGKRFQAEYFLETAHDETHGCDYLLADDIDMDRRTRKQRVSQVANAGHEFAANIGAVEIEGDVGRHGEPDLVGRGSLDGDAGRRKACAQRLFGAVHLLSRVLRVEERR